MASATLQYESQIPRVSGVIARPRLLTLLQGALEHKLTLVCAPPGYGKTTLTAQFAAQTLQPVAWHTVEERERDLPNLLSHALEALEPTVPHIGSILSSPGYAASESAALIADYVRSYATRGLIYILDDVHLLIGSTASEDWLHTLVERFPPHCHLILTGRMLPKLPVTEMIARGEILAVGQEQLRFTAEEIFELSNKTGGTVASMAEATELAVRLEGWPAGTVLALHPLPSELARIMLRGGTGPEALFDGLATLMLDAQPPGLRHFLLTSSTLTRMTPEMCSTVLQTSDSTYWLEEAQNRNLFLTRVSGGLVYHRLFRSFLQKQLREDNPQQFFNLHTKAARWFEQNDRIDESFEHYMTAGLIERAAGLAERVAHSFFAQGQIETLLRWRTRLGEIGVLAPGLLHNCARIYTDRYDYDEATSLLDQAERGFSESRDAVGMAEVELQRAFIKLQRGDHQRAAFDVAHLAEDGSVPVPLRGRAARILGMAHLRMGRIESAVDYLEHALDLHRQDGEAHALANVLQDLSYAYSRQGRLNDASAALAQVVALQRSLGGASALAAALNNLGYYYHMGGNYVQALETFQEGLSVVARVPDRRVEAALLWSLGDLKRDLNAFDEAQRLYTRSLELIGPGDPWMRSAVLISWATLRRWEGYAAESTSLAEMALKLASKHGVALERAVAEAALWIAQADLDAGEPIGERLDLVIADLQRQGARTKLIWVYALRAYSALLLTDPAAARSFLQIALDEAQQIGILQPLVAEIVHNQALDVYVRRDAQRFGGLTSALDHLEYALQKADPPPAVPRVLNDTNQTYSLRVRTLGQETIKRDGETIALTKWRSSTARELFLYLLFNGPESRETICLAFWPDASPEHVRSNFHTTLYRARQALGENVIIFYDGLYAINADLDLWCAAQALVRLTDQARLMPYRDARAEHLWQKAVELYRGDFLPSWDAEWILYRRESLYETYIEALISLGECARARENVRDALSAYRRALTTDPFREDAHRAVLVCYAETGERQQIVEHLERMTRLFIDELGVEPSGETLSLARRLLS